MVNWTKADIESLGVLSDQALATRRGTSKTEVRNKRISLNKPPSRVKASNWTDAEKALLGERPDEDLAQELGRTLIAVRDARVKARKEPAPEQSVRSGKAKRVHWTEEDLNDLDLMSNAALARRMGIAASTVKLKRVKRDLAKGIASPDDCLSNWSESDKALLGTKPDPEVARLTGKSLKAVQQARYLLGRDAFADRITGKTVKTATRYRPHSWPNLAEMNQRLFFLAMADEYQKAAGTPLTYEVLSALCLWTTHELRNWFESNSEDVSLPLHVRHHVWLSVKAIKMDPRTCNE